MEMVMREATKADLPKGREAQCPICWRIFGSDSTCELHKPYRKPVDESCKEPLSIGLEARERRGLRVWVVPMDKGTAEAVRSASDEQSKGSDEPGLSTLAEPPDFS